MTSAPEVLLAAFLAMEDGDQVLFLDRAAGARALVSAGGRSEAEIFIGELRRAAEEAGVTAENLTVDLYRAATTSIRLRGEEHAPVSQVIKFFGSWSLSKEALTLARVTTARRIEARFEYRKLGKVWKYTEETLALWMAKAVEAHGRPPQVAEYEWWREKELALAKARNDDTLHIPSPQPFRKRWKTWAGALTALGYDPAAIDSRLERTTAPTPRTMPRGR